MASHVECTRDDLLVVAKYLRPGVPLNLEDVRTLHSIRDDGRHGLALLLHCAPTDGKARRHFHLLQLAGGCSTEWRETGDQSMAQE